MPELPEVERARGAAARVAVGRRITGVRVADDPIVFGRLAPGRQMGDDDEGEPGLFRCRAEQRLQRLDAAGRRADADYR